MARKPRTGRPFQLDLSDEHRAKLEAHRVALGLRSHAEVFRWWIENMTPLHYGGPHGGFPNKSMPTGFDWREVPVPPADASLSVPQMDVRANSRKAVHHIDGNPHNNSPSNLATVSLPLGQVRKAQQKKLK